MNRQRKSLSLKRPNSIFSLPKRQSVCIEVKDIIKIHSSNIKKNTIRNTYSRNKGHQNMDMIIPSLAYGPSYRQMIADASFFQENNISRPATTSFKRTKIRQKDEDNIKLSKYLSDFTTQPRKIQSKTQRKSGLSYQFISNQIGSVQRRRSSFLKSGRKQQKKHEYSFFNERSPKRVDRQREKGKNVEFILRRKIIKNFDDSMRQYCQRMKIAEGSKVFIFQSQDSHIKKALIKSGWIQNKDPDSIFFHLKWSSKTMKTNKLHSKQYFNHFQQSDLLTSKQGLMKIIRPCKQLRKTVPRSFDIGQRDVLIQNMVETQILCGLKKIVKYLTEEIDEKIEQMEHNKLKKNFNRMRTQNNYEDISKQKNSILLHIPYIVQMLALCENIRCRLQGDKINQQNILNSKTLRNLASFTKLSPPYDQYLKSRSINNQIPSTNHRIIFDPHDINLFSAPSPFAYISPIAKSLLQSYHLYFTQHLNTYAVEGLHNIWILKNRNSSKGVGISLVTSPQEIFKKNQNKMVQKYIQNCILYSVGGGQAQYKFDLRVWVLVKNIYPLQAYFFNEYYCRICSRPYDLNDLNKLEGHLTNFSVNKKYFKNDQVQYSVISKKSMISNICEQFFPDKYQQVSRQIDSKLKNVVKNALMQYCGLFSNNTSGKNCFQLYGFDILLSRNHVSNQINLHLLEVNLSPACKERAQWLNDNLSQMSQSLLKIVLNDKNFRQEQQQNPYWTQIL